MKIHLGQIKVSAKFHVKNSGFVDSGFVKTCDELVVGFLVPNLFIIFTNLLIIWMNSLISIRMTMKNRQLVLVDSLKQL